MGPYLVTYKGQYRKGINVYFKVDYLKLNKNNKPEYDFTLEPHIQDNKKTNQKSPEPDTKHYISRDIYTHVTAADLNRDTSVKMKTGFSEAKNYIGHVGDTIFADNAIIIIDSLRTNVGKEQYQKNDSLLIVSAVLKAFDSKSNSFYAYPKYIIKKNVVIPEADEIEKLGLKFVFWKINPDEGTVEITMSEKLSNKKDFIVMEAAVFPFINILWTGCIIMIIGTILAIRERVKKLVG